MLLSVYASDEETKCLTILTPDVCVCVYVCSQICEPWQSSSNSNIYCIAPSRSQILALFPGSRFWLILEAMSSSLDIFHMLDVALCWCLSCLSPKQTLNMYSPLTTQEEYLGSKNFLLARKVRRNPGPQLSPHSCFYSSPLYKTIVGLEQYCWHCNWHPIVYAFRFWLRGRLFEMIMVARSNVHKLLCVCVCVCVCVYMRSFVLSSVCVYLRTCVHAKLRFIRCATDQVLYFTLDFSLPYTVSGNIFGTKLVASFLGCPHAQMQWLGNETISMAPLAQAFYFVKKKKPFALWKN